MEGTRKMFRINCSMDMLEKFKEYTKEHRLDDDADKNVLICTKIAVNLSNDILRIIKEKEYEYKLFSDEEILKIEKALNESKDNTKIYRTKDGQHYALEPILNDGRYCTEKECDVAGIYSIPEKFKIFISAGRLRFEDFIDLVDNKGEPSIGVYKDATLEIIELKKAKTDLLKNKKAMKDIEKRLRDSKVNNGDNQKNKEKIKQVSELCQEINELNNLYENSKEKFYFDYDGVIELLGKTKDKIETSLGCSRSDNLPDDIALCEMINSDYEFDPIVYDGSMSIKDFEKVQEASLKEIEKSFKKDVRNYSNNSSKNRDLERYK